MFFSGCSRVLRVFSRVFCGFLVFSRVFGVFLIFSSVFVFFF